MSSSKRARRRRRLKTVWVPLTSADVIRMRELLAPHLMSMAEWCAQYAKRVEELRRQVAEGVVRPWIEKMQAGGAIPPGPYTLTPPATLPKADWIGKYPEDMEWETDGRYQRLNVPYRVFSGMDPAGSEPDRTVTAVIHPADPPAANLCPPAPEPGLPGG